MWFILRLWWRGRQGIYKVGKTKVQVKKTEYQIRLYGLYFVIFKSMWYLKLFYLDISVRVTSRPIKSKKITLLYAFHIKILDFSGTRILLFTLKRFFLEIIFCSRLKVRTYTKAYIGYLFWTIVRVQYLFYKATAN